MDGFEVMPIVEAAKHGDFFVTVTGNKDCITREAFEVMKDGAVLANAGHFDVEISKPDLRAMSKSVRTVRKNIEEYAFHDGRKVYLLAEGRLVNLASGDGHPAEVMDMTFSLQALGLREVVTGNYQPGLHSIPKHLDDMVATMRLQEWGISIDTLTEAQIKYLSSWTE
jgi:adenosylhomocysteinase